MPINVQVTGTAASGRKNGVDYKVQTSATIASGRKDVTEIWYQATGTNAAGRRSVWRRQIGGDVEYYHDFDQMSGSDSWKEYILYLPDVANAPANYPGVPSWFTYNTPKAIVDGFLSMYPFLTVQLLQGQADLWWNPDLETFDFPYRTPEYWNEDPPYRYGFGIFYM